MLLFQLAIELRFGQRILTVAHFRVGPRVGEQESLRIGSVEKVTPVLFLQHRSTAKEYKH
jgi:hypothetical protein